MTLSQLTKALPLKLNYPKSCARPAVAGPKSSSSFTGGGADPSVGVSAAEGLAKNRVEFNAGLGGDGGSGGDHAAVVKGGAKPSSLLSLIVRGVVLYVFVGDG